jgi:hypothetical protein
MNSLPKIIQNMRLVSLKLERGSWEWKKSSTRLLWAKKESEMNRTVNPLYWSPFRIHCKMLELLLKYVRFLYLSPVVWFLLATANLYIRQGLIAIFLQRPRDKLWVYRSLLCVRNIIRSLVAYNITARNCQICIAFDASVSCTVMYWEVTFKTFRLFLPLTLLSFILLFIP